MFILYDDNGTNNTDPIVFTYPAMNLPTNFNFNFAKNFANVKTLDTQIFIDDIFEPENTSDNNKKIEIKVPIIDKTKKIVGILGI